jgi:hypothetical protein
MATEPLPAGHGLGMTTTSESDLDVVLGALTNWLEANWDPELPLREWWQRLGESGWAQPHWAMLVHEAGGELPGLPSLVLGLSRDLCAAAVSWR